MSLSPLHFHSENVLLVSQGKKGLTRLFSACLSYLQLKMRDEFLKYFLLFKFGDGDGSIRRPVTSFPNLVPTTQGLEHQTRLSDLPGRPPDRAARQYERTVGRLVGLELNRR